MPTPASWMQRCLQLARLGAGGAAPNPMVGAVLVQGDRVLAEGWHQQQGGPHAEVNCLRAFGDGPVPPDAVLYVNLEPCDHHGHTPPCTELILARGIKQVVIGQVDPFPAVSGTGVARLKAAGVDVQVGICEDEARWTNRRFLTSVEKGRPYILLKWAQSADGFLDRHPRGERGSQRISSAATDALVHRWRSEEQAIMVGSRTVLNDDPRLDVRLVEGRSPMRIVLDRKSIAPSGSKVFDGSRPTLLFSADVRKDVSVETIIVRDNNDPLSEVLGALHHRNIRSLMVEGGAEILGHFIQRGLWDEARVITGPQHFGSGTRAPLLSSPLRSFEHDVDRIAYFVNENNIPAPERTWPW